ncbi:MAG: hypothetical protein M5U34_20695 [Chloroflexi bacterium]|nr:hypothetical protein [Chloroflexota bacterium]
MPGAEKEQLRQAMRYANRLSVNLEAPNDKRLALLAPKKQFLAELVRPLQMIEEIRQNEPAHLGWNGRWPSTTTQFVVGAVGNRPGTAFHVRNISTSKYESPALTTLPSAPYLTHHWPICPLPTGCANTVFTRPLFSSAITALTSRIYRLRRKEIYLWKSILNWPGRNPICKTILWS